MIVFLNRYSSIASIILGSILLTSVSANAQENVNFREDRLLKQIEQYSNEGQKQKNSIVQSAAPEAIEQVTNVNQLQDVSPNDWAFEALQSLVERYGCIAGYPNNTFRGNKPLSRYEFAAGLNACLNQIERLVASNRSILQEDIAKLQRLSEEFQTELGTLGTKIDNLETRTAFLEDHQFSTTTKLAGEVIFAVTSAFDGSVDNDNTVFQNRVRLKLQTSFTGKDTLYTRLDAGNAPRFNLPDDTSEGTQTFNLNPGNNDVVIGWLAYYFPVNNKIDAYIGAVNGVWFDYIPTANPLLDSATGGGLALTEFASHNPIYEISGGSGAGFNFKPNEKLTLSAGYFGSTRASNPNEGNGLFNGEYGALAQVYFAPNDNSGIALTYVRSYQNQGGLFAQGGGVPFQGTAQANTPFDRFTANSYGASAFYQFSPNIAFNGFFGYTDTEDTGDNNSADIFYYALGLAFPDLGKQGNLGGIIVGAEPYLDDNPPPSDDLSLHIEGFYKYQLNENIAITPGVIWITAPGQNDNNDDAIIGTIRTTFVF